METKFKQWDCFVSPAKYGNGRKALELIDSHDGERVAVATVNMVNNTPTDDESVFVKNYSENSGMVQSLVESGIIEDQILQTIPAGFISVSEYRLTDQALVNLFGYKSMAGKLIKPISIHDG